MFVHWGRVSDHSLEELKALDAGSWFHPDFAGESLPELGEVLDLVCGDILVWPRFGNAKFKPTMAGANIPGYIEEGPEYT
jgi:hypothetical protein